MLRAGGSATITAHLTDGSNDPVAGEPVEFHIAGPSSASLSATTMQTGAGGVAKTIAKDSGAGTAAVWAITDAGTVTDSISLQWLPSITSVKPGTGPKGGGTRVTITGHGFAAGARVFFGRRRATKVVLVSPAKIKATTPRGRGTVNVVVTVPGGMTSKTKADRFTYV
jgi:IPT/TIG domain-containing protein/Big-like domain-containing protein